MAKLKLHRRWAHGMTRCGRVANGVNSTSDDASVTCARCRNATVICEVCECTMAEACSTRETGVCEPCTAAIADPAHASRLYEMGLYSRQDFDRILSLAEAKRRASLSARG